MSDLRFRIGVYLMAVATLTFLARFVMPRFVGMEDSVLWEYLVFFAMIIYVIAAVFLFLGRKHKDD